MHSRLVFPEDHTSRLSFHHFAYQNSSTFRQSSAAHTALRHQGHNTLVFPEDHTSRSPYIRLYVQNNTISHLCTSDLLHNPQMKSNIEFYRLLLPSQNKQHRNLYQNNIFFHLSPALHTPWYRQVHNRLAFPEDHASRLSSLRSAYQSSRTSHQSSAVRTASRHPGRNKLFFPGNHTSLVPYNRFPSQKNNIYR